MTTTVLVTGAGGFIGSRVAAAARRRPDVRVRLMSRPAPDTDDRPRPAAAVHCDLARPALLPGTCTGVDVLIHCASRVTGDPAAAAAVNDQGTRALVREALRSGVQRIVYVSTAAVYGRGPFRGVRPGEVPIAPASAVSCTRAAAERHVLAAGGLVLRPHLVYGEGDRWVVPGLAALVREIWATTVRGCAARHSMIDVETLGRAVVAAALSPAHRTGVHHVNHPQPVAGSDLLQTVGGLLGGPGGPAGVDAATARSRAAGSALARHHLDLLTVDHWFSDDRFWDGLDCAPARAAGFQEEFRRAEPWYLAALRGT